MNQISFARLPRCHSHIAVDCMDYEEAEEKIDPDYVEGDSEDDFY